MMPTTKDDDRDIDRCLDDAGLAVVPLTERGSGCTVKFTVKSDTLLKEIMVAYATLVGLNPNKVTFLDWHDAPCDPHALAATLGPAGLQATAPCGTMMDKLDKDYDVDLARCAAWELRRKLIQARGGTNSQQPYRSPSSAL